MKVNVKIIQLKYTAQTNCGKGQTIRKVIARGRVQNFQAP